MCGFLTVFSENNNRRFIKALREATKITKHRGPDKTSYLYDENYLFSFNRLSIQDTSNDANQPMFSENKRYLIVFNGEIYNFKKLRQILIHKGIKFKSTGDTEVLINLFQIYKEKVLNIIEGIFSFVIFDKINKEIFVARDEFGVKPVYFFKKNNLIIISSELKAFLPFAKLGLIDWSLNEKHIKEQLIFRTLSGNQTLIKQVKKILPGHYLSASKNKFTIVKYFNPNTFTKSNNLKKEYLIEYIEYLLSKSIKDQLVSDVKKGIALSGGLDSSLLVALSSKFDLKNINTYSVFFKEKTYNNKIIDESKFINYIVKKYKTDHHKILLDEKKFTQLFPKCVWFNDEPLNFPHSIGIFLLAKLARENNCKVLLGGEGSDEFFAGYSFFNENNLNKFKYKFSDPKAVNKLLNFKSNEKFTREKFLLTKFKSINKQIYFASQTYLQSIENRLDKMSMANSVEFRVPFINKKLYQASLNLDNSFKINNGETKYILKKIAENHFHKKHIYRPKIGFSTPINKWIRNKKLFGNYIKLLEEKKFKERGIFEKREIDLLLKRFYDNPKESPNYSNAGLIWSILNLEIWMRYFIDNKQFKF